MAKKRTRPSPNVAKTAVVDYDGVLAEVVALLDAARRAAARSVNAIITATYWEIGRRLVEIEQSGMQRADYGTELLKRLAEDLTARYGRGFSRANLEYMRRFYVAWPISQTASGKSAGSPDQRFAAKSQTVSGELAPAAARFPLPWSHYVRLLGVADDDARTFYEAEAIRGGWSVRQLTRQIDSQFYQRTLLSRKQATILAKGQQPQPGDEVTADEEIKDPYVLEFLNLKDEYSESDIETALIENLEAFLMELGGDFAFVGRQRRLRIDDEWYRIDLLFFHRRLRCLVIIDLKLGKFSHADAGQMHLYLNYAREHWVVEGENPPVGLILCASKGAMLAKYALDGLPNKVIAAEYRTKLPKEAELQARLEETRRRIESKSAGK